MFWDFLSGGWLQESRDSCLEAGYRSLETPVWRLATEITGPRTLTMNPWNPNAPENHIERALIRD